MIGKLYKARFELVGLLHDGPIFATYAARDRIQGRDLSVRVLKQPYGQEREFVERLAKTVLKYSVIQTANVERLSSVETDDGVSFILGDLTRGPSLADRIRKLAPFSIPVSIGTAISILHALESIHRHGLVHGDLNPQNLAVMADGDVRLQLTGVWEAYSSSPTAGVMVLPGMAPYLAPEVSAGAMPSSCSDVYAVGILLYELISGRSPYRADTPLALAMQHSTASTPSLRAISLAVPVVLDEIVKKAMSKDPGSRYGSAGEMLADLRMLQDALRFGRSLTWPLHSDLQSGPGSSGRGPAARPQPVAPKMSAIRKSEQREENESARKERDVPVWMLLVFTIGMTSFLLCIGLWFFQNLSRTVWVTVPNIKNRTVAEATSLLKESKLTLRISRREPNEVIEQDNVLDSTPGAGQKVRQGDQVSVVVSSGSRSVKIPDLNGLTVDKAKALLGTLNLILADTIESVADQNITAGLIVRSDPPARTAVPRKSSIKVFVSTGPGKETDNPPTGDAQDYIYTLHLRVKDLTHPTRVRIRMLDDKGPRTIYNTIHHDGDEFDVIAKGEFPKATFNIYYDGVLVKSVDKDVDADEPNDPIQPEVNANGDTP